MPVAAGVSASEVNAALARRGAALLARAVGQVETGALSESGQDEARATWFGWPDESAFRIPTSWTAERAFRFMRGVAEWGRPFSIEAGGETLVAVRALDFEVQGGREGRCTARREGGDGRVRLRHAARASFPRLGARLARLNPKRGHGGGGILPRTLVSSYLLDGEAYGSTTAILDRLPTRCQYGRNADGLC